MPRPNNNSSNQHTSPHTSPGGWRVLETKVKGTAAVRVSVLPLRVPRYSFKVGAAQFDEQTGEVRLGPFVTIFNYEDAADLLKTLGDKYSALRESKIDEVEALKEKWQHAHAADAPADIEGDGPLNVEPPDDK